MLGPTALAARLPFAVAALATIALLYAMVWRVTTRRSTAVAAGVLLLCSVQFLLYARQARNYSLTMALCCAMVLLFWRLTSRRAAIAFAICAVLAFHTSPTLWAPWGALGMLTLIAPSCRAYRRWYWRTAPFVLAFTAPWVLLAKRGYHENVDLIASLSALPGRVAQFSIEYASITPVLAVVAIAIVVQVRRPRQASPPASSRTRARAARPASRIAAVPLDWRPGERLFLVTATGVAIGYGLLLTATESADNLYVAGLRYAAPLMPLTAGAAAIALARVTTTRTARFAAAVAVLALTNIARLTPWATLLESSDGPAAPSAHAAASWQTSILRTSLVSFVRELHTGQPGTVAAVSDFLETHAAPGDVVITNYGWEPLYFHTGLPQGLRLPSSSPAYASAKLNGLPDFVFGVTRARWLVWRWAWDGYMNTSFDVVTRRLAEDGARLTKVADVPETVWENRENLHFHRFAKDGYLFDRASGEERDAEIYRVDW